MLFILRYEEKRKLKLLVTTASSALLCFVLPAFGVTLEVVLCCESKDLAQLAIEGFLCELYALEF